LGDLISCLQSRVNRTVDPRFLAPQSRPPNPATRAPARRNSSALSSSPLSRLESVLIIRPIPQSRPPTLPGVFAHLHAYAAGSTLQRAVQVSGSADIRLHLAMPFLSASYSSGQRFAYSFLWHRVQRASRHLSPNFRTAMQISRGKLDCFHHTPARSTTPPLDGYALRGHWSALVQTSRPHIWFLFVRLWLCSTLPSDLASRRRPCASLDLHHHQVGQRICTSRLSNMLGTPKKVGGPLGRRSQCAYLTLFS
jgi:hypothetical protein